MRQQNRRSREVQQKWWVEKPLYEQQANKDPSHCRGEQRSEVCKIMDSMEHTRRAIQWTPTECSAEQVQNQQKKPILPTTQSCETACLRLKWMPECSQIQEVSRQIHRKLRSWVWRQHKSFRSSRSQKTRSREF